MQSTTSYCFVPVTTVHVVAPDAGSNRNSPSSSSSTSSNNSPTMGSRDDSSSTTSTRSALESGCIELFMEFAARSSQVTFVQFSSERLPPDIRWAVQLEEGWQLNDRQSAIQDTYSSAIQGITSRNGSPSEIRAAAYGPSNDCQCFYGFLRSHRAVRNEPGLRPVDDGSMRSSVGTPSSNESTSSEN